MPVANLPLADSTTIPQLGLGVYLVPDDEAQAVVEKALELGYRHIDSAMIYRNEVGVGRALAATGVPRDDIFITTKLWNSDQGRDTAKPALEASLERLGLDRVDLYLIHWPNPTRDVYVETWEVLQGAAEEGLATSIGVSNFLPHHLGRVRKLGGRMPVVNQIEIHPGWQQRDVQEANAQIGALSEAWSPIGQGQSLKMPEIVAIAERIGATPAQVIIAWHLLQGRIVIPKSVNPQRMAENLASAELTLSAADRAAIDQLDGAGRIGPNPDDFNP